MRKIPMKMDCQIKGLDETLLSRHNGVVGISTLPALFISWMPIWIPTLCVKETV